MNQGERYCAFIENLKVPNGEHEGKLIRLLDWQREFIETVFGTYTPEGLRKIREALLFIPKKNGKTTLIAALMVASLFLENRRNAEIFSCANSREQAANIYKQATAMIEADEWLKANSQRLKSKKQITNLITGTVYTALSAEVNDKNGFTNPVLCLFDEIAEFKKPDLYHKLKTGMIASKEPLVISLTTAGTDTNNIGYEIYNVAKQCIADPSFDPAFLPVIYESPPQEDWTDIEVWKRCNPSWGATVREEYATRTIAEAKAVPTRLNELLRYHLNRWVNDRTAWIPELIWKECGNLPFDFESLKGQVCDVGLDLASVQDMAAAVLTFLLEDGRLAVIPRYYLPQETAVERSKRDHVPYLTWIQQGHIIPTSGAATDYDFIRADLNKLADAYQIRRIVIDRNLQGAQLATQLSGDGFTVNPFGLGFYSMTPPCRELERLWLTRKLLHSNHPVLNWNARNVIVEQDAAGGVKPSKRNSIEKIDGIVALLMGLGASLVEGGSGGKSVYEERGILTL